MIVFLLIFASVLAGVLGLLTGAFPLLVAALGFVVAGAWVSSTRQAVVA